MPVVCSACGSKNRENAKFCMGCARPLPGFVPTGPSALETLDGSRAPLAPAFPSARSARSTFRRDDPLALLPAETPAFWLRLGLLGVGMGLVFIGWYVYVTRDFAAPQMLNRISAALALEDRKPAADEPPVALAAPSASAAEAVRPAPATQAPAKPTPTPKAAAVSAGPERSASTAAPSASSPAAATPATQSRGTWTGTAERKRGEAAPGVRQPRTPAWADADPEPAVPAAPAMSWVSPPGWRRDEPSPQRSIPAPATAPAPVVASQRGSSWNRGDGGPPVAPGPGPVYNFGSPGSSTSAGNDAGPPVAPGPGPLTGARRAPAVGGGDSGPPIAVGPGPVYNWTSTRER